MAAVKAVEDNLSAKAAGNESVDGRMMACDDKIGWRTTNQQPTNERRRGGGGSARSAAAWRRRGGGGRAVAAARQLRRWRQHESATSAAAWSRRGGGSSATARCWWQLGGGAAAAAVSTRRCTARRRQAMDGARARAIDGVTATLWQRNVRWTATKDQKGRKTSSLAAAKRGRGKRLKRRWGKIPRPKVFHINTKVFHVDTKINLFARK